MPLSGPPGYGSVVRATCRTGTASQRSARGARVTNRAIRPRLQRETVKVSGEDKVQCSLPGDLTLHECASYDLIMPLVVAVRNFGPIVSGTVAVKSFNVFVGPNNSGKSFMSALIYSAMLPYRGSQRSRVAYLRLPSPLMELVPDIKRVILGKLNNEKNLPRLFSSMSPVDRALVAKAAETDLTTYARSVVQELERCMAGTLADFVRVNSKPGRAPMTISIRDTDLRWTVQITCSEDSVQYEIRQLPRIAPLLQEMDRAIFDWFRGVFPVPREGEHRPELGLSIFGPPGSETRIGALEEVSTEVARQSLQALHYYLFRHLPLDRYYLPASRSGIMQSHKVLTSVYVSTASLVGLRRMEVPPLSGIVGDFISQLLTLETTRKRPVRPQTRLPQLAGQLEKDILHGSVTMETLGEEYPEISYRSGLLEAPLVRLSSMIGELAPVVLYLRYVLSPGDHLIIEEPEAHLHPESQRTFGRILTQVSLGGIAITLTTHSDYMLTEINNVIREGTLVSSQNTSAEEPSLFAGHHVGAYLFQRSESSGGTIIRGLKVTESEGIPDDEFGRVAQAMYQDATALQYRLIDAGIDIDAEEG